MGLAGRKILVSGGTGFIGSHLVESLVSLDANVVVPYQSSDPKSFFKDRKLDKQIILASCDLKNFQRVFEIICKYEIDYIFHLAAQSIVTVAYDNPKGTFDNNILGTVNIMEAARLYGKVSGILVTSSDKAYGKLPRVSEKNPVGGDHPYESSKAAADIIARSYFKTFNLPITVTRFGNVYGEGDLNFSRIIPGIMRAIVKNEVLDIRSNGKYVRDYVYVGDIVYGMIVLMKNIKKVNGEAFNISSFENISVVEVVKKVQSLLGQKVKYRILGTAFNEIPKQSVNFNKIRSAFDWKPKNNFKSTIPQIYEWYKSYFNQV